MIDEEDDSFKGNADSIETSIFQGDLYNIPRPSKEQVEMDNYQNYEQIKIDKEFERLKIYNETAYLKMHEEIEMDKVENEKFRKEELEEKQRLEAEHKAKLI